MASGSRPVAAVVLMVFGALASASPMAQEQGGYPEKSVGGPKVIYCAGGLLGRDRRAA